MYLFIRVYKLNLSKSDYLRPVSDSQNIYQKSSIRMKFT